MNAVANKSPRRRAPRSIVAKLDLSDPGQRRLHGLIVRMHGGRQPTLRALDMRQIGNAIHEAVQWFPTATPSYAVICWQADGRGLSWRETPSEAAARAMLKALK